jgi:tRNA nucleotidyltransferase (CCA-adding enzyme)
MQIYLVGGAVRDALMGLPVTDRDWVVVGATPEHMVQQGFRPVGKDFPVFLHPQTGEEYALARTERKTAPGYRGFTFHTAPDITLEQDLARRDLTINAMAAPAQADAQGGLQADLSRLVDPYGGAADLAAGRLRHVGDAFREDPVRVLRLARLAARFSGFTVANDTQQLLLQMVASGELDHLVAERVWQELSKGLMTDRPSRMFEVLRHCGALQVVLPELDRLWGVPQPAEHHPEVDSGVHTLMVVDESAKAQAPLFVRLACLLHDLGKGTTPPDQWPRHLGHEGRSERLLRKVCERWRVPKEGRELAEVVAREHGNIHRSAQLDAAAVVRLLERCDALRRPQRFRDALLACTCDARGRLHREHAPYPQADRLATALQAALTVDAGAALAAAQAHRPPQAPPLQGEALARIVAAERVKAVAAVWGATGISNRPEWPLDGTKGA